MDNRKSVTDTAKLILINVKLYADEKDKEVSRHRFSPETLRRISKRKSIRGAFIKSLIDELAEFGWTLIKLDNDYALIETDKVSSWIKLSSKRLKNKISILILIKFLRFLIVISPNFGQTLKIINYIKKSPLKGDFLH